MFGYSTNSKDMFIFQKNERWSIQFIKCLLPDWSKTRHVFSSAITSYYDTLISKPSVKNSFQVPSF